MSEKELLSAAEAAEKLKIAKRTLLRWSREGRIERVRISPKLVLFSIEAIEEFVKSRTNGIESQRTKYQPAGRKMSGPNLNKKGGNSPSSRKSWRSLREEVATWQ